MACSVLVSIVSIDEVEDSSSDENMGVGQWPTCSKAAAKQANWRAEIEEKVQRDAEVMGEEERTRLSEDYERLTSDLQYRTETYQKAVNRRRNELFQKMGPGVQAALDDLADPVLVEEFAQHVEQLLVLLGRHHRQPVDHDALLEGRVHLRLLVLELDGLLVAAVVVRAAGLARALAARHNCAEGRRRRGRARWRRGGALAAQPRGRA